MHAFASEVVEVTWKILWAQVYSVRHSETYNKGTSFSDLIFPPSLSLFELNLAACLGQCFVSARWTALPLWSHELPALPVSNPAARGGNLCLRQDNSPASSHTLPDSPSCLFSCMLHQAELLHQTFSSHALSLCLAEKQEKRDSGMELGSPSTAYSRGPWKYQQKICWIIWWFFTALLYLSTQKLFVYCMPF